MPATLPGTVEQTVRARLVTADGRGPERAVTVALRYTAADPLAVHLVFPPEVTLAGREVTWTFGRSLLAEGLGTPAGGGDVHVWPCGRARTVIELHAPEGMAVVQFDTSALRRFLERSYAVVPVGAEDVGAVIERALTALFRADEGGEGE
ncbi:SsgA family sporulation/cell division regulator [Streptomyces beihaiensis]|uniref:SsgA family sporulation/cell division regulator n=1 Tax=Streptomyces beihaiensis TaxID=2984495 RepID=A0ABT3TYY6_9ACTN|nr:SsgA family sporulation/cell division regulator [Streptomyces beihaiensis]MCX3061198.1 SsgA family sporulation/cell division regulator [Streptomyces beihaiensis]